MPGWILLTQEQPLVYEKELIHEGAVYRRLPNGQVGKLEFSKAFLEHVVDNFLKMSETGVKIPHYLRHVTKEENRLGTVLDLTLRENSKGKMAIFLKTEFADEKSRDLALKSDVSIGLMQDYLDPKGNMYKWAMDHVATTDRPNVPGLEGYQAIAASLDYSNLIGDIDVDELLTLLELQLDEAMAPEEKLAAIIEAVKALKAKADGAGKEDEPGAGSGPTQMSGAGLPATSTPAGGAPSKVTVQFSQPLLQQVVRYRQGEIQSLLEDGKISPAVASDLNAQHSTVDSVRLSCEQDDSSFDKMIEMLKKNVAHTRQGAGSEIRLSLDKNENPLVEACDEMAKARA